MPGPAGRADALTWQVCGGPDHPLAPVLRRWLVSRAFLAFAEAHAPKLGKKVRLAASEAEQADLRAELAFAAWLLRDARVGLVYEPDRQAGRRGPDFRVTFRGHPAGHAEVTRPRLPGEAAETAARRLARVIGDKIGQLPTGGANLLVVVLPLGVGRAALVAAAVALLERPNGGPDPRPEAVEVYRRGGQRLSAVLLASFAPDGDLVGGPLWPNPRARHALPPGLVRVLTAPET